MVSPSLNRPHNMYKLDSAGMPIYYADCCFAAGLRFFRNGDWITMRDQITPAFAHYMICFADAYRKKWRYL